MGKSEGAARRQPRARSIRFRFATRLAVPVFCLALLCAAAVGAAVGGPLNELRWLGSGTLRQRALTESAAVAGAALVVVVIAIAAVGSFARRLSREISELTAAALRLADEQLPRAVRELRDGRADAAPAAATQTGQWMIAPPARVRTAEVAAAVAAITRIERTAVSAANAEAGLRNGLRQILMSLGRRNQSLLHRQLRIIDKLEEQAPTPGALADLFALDHLTTRMRRHAESLTILSGAGPARSWSGPVPVIDVIRAAVAETEDYQRVTVLTEATDAVTAPAVTDMIHLLAELIENATLFSPSSTHVEVRAERVANGFAIEVEDRGLGIAPGQLRELNERLASPPDFDTADADRLGLFVAGRLAARHDVQVSLGPSAYRGTRAVVILPDSLITRVDPAGAGSVTRGADEKEARPPDVLSLVGATAHSMTPAPWSGTAQDGSRGPEPPWASSAHGALGDAALTGTSAPAAHRLPRRVRPDRLSRPGEESGEVRVPGGLVPPDGPSPELARNLAASVQRSWQRSRDADVTGTDPGPADSEESHG